MRLVRVSFAVLSLAWLALLVAAPLSALGVPASGLTYALASLVCHQRSDRSFHLADAQLPVCARCFGLYLGAALGVLIWRTPASRRGVRLAVIAAAVPTALSWTLEVASLWDPGNALRGTAALPLGAAAALTVNYVECVRQPPPTAAAPTPTRT